MFAQIAYTFSALFNSSGFAVVTGPNLIMILLSAVLIYLGIAKGVEPLLMLPIAFGMLLANLPLSGILGPPVQEMVLLEYIRDASGHYLPVTPEIIEAVRNGGYTYILGLGQSFAIEGGQLFQVITQQPGGLLFYFYLGVGLVVFPPLIFLGIGAMIDFGPLIAFPSSFIIGAAAQLGIFATFLGALWLGFSPQESSAIAIIGSADGPTTIFVTATLAPHLLGSVAIAAYTYMALVPIIQPPFMKALTNDKERRVVMKQLRPVSKTERCVFPVLSALGVALLVPPATPLLGMLMLGNLIKESGVCERLSQTAQNEMINIVTIFLGLAVGSTARAENFLTAQTLMIIALGLAAFILSTITGVLIAKVMCFATGGKINPLIGSAGVSAMPMAARVCQQVGAKYDPNNFLLMHAMGPTVSATIGSAVVAGAMIAILS
ncbi:MAG: sodium ion-translocating decarboxylase subunit beta [Oscillospiraceae bacterium]|nr:sodium ion-translocating decarboxylase subunit beta [Oscillospiraceae bacterium]